MTKPCKTVNINGTEDVRSDLTKPATPDSNGSPFVIIRAHNAGVFAGYLRERDNKTQRVMMDNCIRLHRWTGCSLSQVANDGVAGGGENRFSMQTNAHEILGVIEIIPCTEKARIAIQGVRTWKL